MQNRRVRHINPASSGANFVLDARFITGLADGAAVNTWYDRSPAGNDATVPLTFTAPVYKVNIQGGLPAVQFAAPTTHLLTTPAFTSGLLFIVVNYTNATFGNYPGAVVQLPNPAFGFTGEAGSTRWFDFGMQNGFWKNGAAIAMSTAGSGPMQKFDQYTLKAITPASAIMYVGKDRIYNSHWLGYIASAFSFAANTSDSIRKRYQQSTGFIWRIATS